MEITNKKTIATLPKSSKSEILVETFDMDEKPFVGIREFMTEGNYIGPTKKGIVLSKESIKPLLEALSKIV